MNLSEKYEFRSIRREEAEQVAELFSSGRGDKQRGYYRPGEKNPGAVSCGRRQGKRKTGRISYGSYNR